MSITEKDAEYLKGLMKLPHVGSRGADAIYEEVKNQGKAYDTKTKSGLTLAKVKEWYKSRETVQTHQRISGYHSFTPERPKQQFQIDLITMKEAWRNQRNKYSLVCVDVFTKYADMEPMKDKEADTCNKAMEKIFEKMGIPESIYCDEGSEFTNKKFLQLLERHNIEIIYATNHAPFVESFNRTMKRMMDRYMESNEDVTTWTSIYRELLKAYNNTKHSTTGFKPDEIHNKDIDTVRKNIRNRAISKNYEEVRPGDTVRLQLKEKSFRKESDPTYTKDLYTVQANRHNGLYIVDGDLHTRKDLQLVKGTVIPAKQKTAQQIKEDRIGKAAYNPELKELTGKRQSLKKVEQMITEPRQTRSQTKNRNN